jgi:adenylate kinase
MGHDRPDLIITGAPGSGKTTHAARVAQRLGAARVNPGAIFRQIAEGDAPGSDQIREAMAQGRAVPDELTDALVGERIAAVPPEQPLVLEGYPRSAAQAAALRRILGRLGRLQPRPLVLDLDVPRDELVKRLRGRRDVEGRGDDTDDVIARRLAAHDAQAGPVADALADWADTARIDGDQPVDAVTDEILAALQRPP